MPPSRPRALVDDLRSESSGQHTAKAIMNVTSTTASKGKRATNNHANASANGKSTVATNGTGTGAVVAAADPDAPKITWSTFSLQTLHSYRQAYHLPGPSAYSNPHAQHIFSHGIGARSPSSVIAKRAARTTRRDSKTNSTTNGAGVSKNGAANGDRFSGRPSRDQLASSVRKHFNNLAVSEGEVIAKFRYIVRQGGLAETAHRPREGTGLGGPQTGGVEREFRLRFNP